MKFSLQKFPPPLSPPPPARFDGRVVAKLPFEPFALLRGISHRNLMGNDFTDCSFIFLYILCTMSIREVGPPVCLSNLSLVLFPRGEGLVTFTSSSNFIKFYHIMQVLCYRAEVRRLSVCICYLGG